MNRPRNVLLQHADPRQPVTLEFQHTVGALRHSLQIQQTPDEDCWPGGALWDCGILLSQLVLAVAGVEAVTLRSTYLAEETTHHIVAAPGKNRGTNNTSSSGKKKGTRGNPTKPLSQPAPQSRTTTQLATRLQQWTHSQSPMPVWNDTVLPILTRTPNFRILELGCGVGMTGLVAAVALGAATTILTDLTEVIEGVTVGNVQDNTTVKSGTHRGPNKSGVASPYPVRAIQHFKGGGQIVALPLGWGDLEQGKRVLKLFDELQPPPVAARKGNKKGNNKSKKIVTTPSTTTEDRRGYPHLILLGDVAYQHKPGAPSHFDILLETLQQFMPPLPTTTNTNTTTATDHSTKTLLLFGTRLRMPASMDLLLLLQEHFQEVLPTPLPAHVLDPALEGIKHNMTLHIFSNRTLPHDYR